MTTTKDPEAAFQAKPPLPIESPKVLHKMRIRKTSVSEKDHLALEWKQ
jgi:hypothetical protein